MTILEQPCPNSCSWGQEEREAQRRKTLPLLRFQADKLHYTIEDTQLTQYADQEGGPPDCMQFDLIESMSIPLYGHHFEETKNL